MGEQHSAGTVVLVIGGVATALAVILLIVFLSRFVHPSFRIGPAKPPPKSIIAQLIAELHSPDMEVRRSSFQTLLMLTDQSFGYSPSADDESRRECVAKWEAWWQENRDGLQWNDDEGRFR